MPEKLTCQELVEIVTEYLEGALPTGERARFEAHLAGCQGCTRYLDQIRQTLALTGMLSENSLTEESKAVLLELFRDWKAQRDSSL